MRLPHIRHVIAGVIVASVGVVGTSLLAAPVLTEQSRAGTSYVARLPDNEPLTSVIYDTIAGSLFFKRTADRLVDGLQTDDERIDALVQWTHENVRPQFAAPDRIVQDNAYRIVQRGFGFCDQDAHVFATLAHYAGYDVQLRFLVWPDGVSHHTVAEVKVGDRWIEADPWIGAVIRDGGGRAMTVDDLVRDPAVLGRFGYDVLGVELKPDYFVNGIVFRTYPYEGLGELASTVVSKIRRTPNLIPASVPAVGAPGSAPAGSPATKALIPDDPTFQDQVRLYATARADQLDGDFSLAAETYAQLDRQQLDREMAESVGFFLGLALLRAGQPEEAIDAWTRELAAHLMSE